MTYIKEQKIRVHTLGNDFLGYAREIKGIANAVVDRLAQVVDKTCSEVWQNSEIIGRLQGRRKQRLVLTAFIVSSTCVSAREEQTCE